MTQSLTSLRREIARRMTGPGGLYNLGNGLGLLGGLYVHMATRLDGDSPRLTQGALAVAEYFAGSPGALAITLAMLIFFWSGECYHRAWAHGAPPDAGLNRVGDLSSGWGALVLGAGLFLMGQPVLAATSGAMHAAGKFGSALPGHLQDRLPFGPAVFRLIVAASRLPALLAVLLEVRDALAGGSTLALMAPALLVMCYLLWLRADLTLLRS